MGGLAMGRVSYITWLKFIAPLIVALTLMIMTILSIGVAIY